MIIILDCYTDEPAGLGVPPYLNTYPRYAYGAVKKAGQEAKYLTIDDLRANNRRAAELEKAELIIVIAGIHTPGKYLRTQPATLSEIARYLSKAKGKKILGGPAGALGTISGGGDRIQESQAFQLGELFDHVIQGDIEKAVYGLLTKGRIDTKKHRTYTELSELAIAGAEVIRQHPDFPNFLMCEIETYRGCSRDKYCSFCTEPVRYGRAIYRPSQDILEEIKELYKQGARHFRLGKQPCIYSYQAGKKLNPKAIHELFSGIRETAPELKTLHIDNANPSVIANQPEAAEEITKTLVKYCTPGNVAAFGLESADPRVIEENNLNTSPEECLKAVELLNRIGGKRGENGMPYLLPGLNFVFGLKGETKNTFELNFQFLKKLLDDDLMVRRINLRQVAVFPDTKMQETGTRLIEKHKKLFLKCKKRIREEIDRPMLEKVVPVGTRLTGLRAEISKDGITFCRQTGTYPLIVGVPEEIEQDQVIDAAVVDYGFRSVTALRYPFDMDSCSKKSLEFIPGIGRRIAEKLISSRPLTREKLGDILKDRETFELALELSTL